MKKCILVGVNAKFVHTNLAIRYLKQAASGHDVTCCEVTINDHLSTIMPELLAMNGDYYGFSCYIWNIELIVKIAELLKKSRPETVIFLGGPEVSYDGGKLMADCDWIDYVLCGECEEIFPKFLTALETGREPVSDAVISRKNQSVEGKLAVVSDLDRLPFPYAAEEMADLSGKILYYETMRGCPFQCSYCLSSTLKQVRFMPLDRVFEELQFFIRQKVRQVKFVDRTFNVDRKRTMAILTWLVDHQQQVCGTNFHFEIAADLLDDATIAIIRKAPRGMFQFEIGVQSTDLKTLKAITRKTDLSKIWHNVTGLLNAGNCHVHLDLIAGLPYEDYRTFARSFDTVMAVRPQMLQLGFLKLLKGTRIREEAGQHQYAYASFPPYEVICNQYLSAEELYRLREIEDLLDRYYNSGVFYLTLSALFDLEATASPFAFFERLADYWRSNGFFQMGISRDTLYAIMADYLKKEQLPFYFQELLKLDYLMQGKRALPSFFDNRDLAREKAFDLLKNEHFISSCFPEEPSMPAKKRIKQVFFQYFNRETLDVAARYNPVFKHPGRLCLFEKTRAVVCDEEFVK